MIIKRMRLGKWRFAVHTKLYLNPVCKVGTKRAFWNINTVNSTRVCVSAQACETLATTHKVDIQSQMKRSSEQVTHRFDRRSLYWKQRVWERHSISMKIGDLWKYPRYKNMKMANCGHLMALIKIDSSATMNSLVNLTNPDIS